MPRTKRGQTHGQERPSGADKSERLMLVAREIIRERGDFDLGMRELASRAQVSLRLPYELFGSKAGVIRAILKADQARWAETLMRRPRTGDAFDDQFNQLRLGVAWFGRQEAFYRALFRASQAYSGGDEPDAARENEPIFARWVRRAIREGLVDPKAEPDVVAGALTDIFAANMRVWALTGCDLRLVEARMAYGFATLFATLATPEHTERMREKSQEMQAIVARRANTWRRKLAKRSADPARRISPA